MGIKSFLRDRLFAQRMPPATPSLAQSRCEQSLRTALLKCAALTEAEVDAYIAYEFEGIVYDEVPLDYEPAHPGEEISYLYADGVLQAKTLRRHTNQIAPETLEKVRRVLPGLSEHSLKRRKF